MAETSSQTEHAQASPPDAGAASASASSRSHGQWRASLSRGFDAAFPQTALRRLVGRPAADIWTFTSIPERLFLAQQASHTLKLGTMLEIGSYLGASAVVLAEILRRGQSAGEPKLYCVDTWGNETMPEGTRNTMDLFNANTRRWGGLIQTIVGDSTSVNVPLDGACDLVFIDADHSYEAARRDADRFAPMLRPGGRLLFHDQDRATVTKVIGELLVTGDWRVHSAVERMISLQRMTPGSF